MKALRALVAVLALLPVLALLALVPAAAQAQAGAGVPRAAHALRGELLRAAHSQWGLNAPVAALAAQVHQESGWRAGALSQVGAQGLAQFMPATARWWCGLQDTPAGGCLPHNPTWALRAMVGYDKWLHDRLASAGPAPARLWATLRAYNGGLGHWQAERAVAVARLGPHAGRMPTRHEVDAQCGQARRAAVHCAENLGYPQRILVGLQPRYAAWGPQVVVAD